MLAFETALNAKLVTASLYFCAFVRGNLGARKDAKTLFFEEPTTHQTSVGTMFRNRKDTAPILHSRISQTVV
jgi:hypothetical protein